MISLTRLNGERIAVNPDLLERAEETPDTVITCTNGTKHVVAESIDEVIARVQAFRATVLALSRKLADDPSVEQVHLRLVRGALAGEGEHADDVFTPADPHGGRP
ncbi:MAG TPA: flagellar FlbD family protein [Acidimicrobiales bacterium]|nr:flagellar FlbD family protein [Acidimicrobiales bacterium]